MTDVFSHDLFWPPKEDLGESRMDVLLQANARAMDAGDESLNTHLSMYLAMHLHVYRGGVQVWVSKEVSFDLDHSDIADPDFSSVPLLADSMEFVFEDPTLPSFLLCRNPVRRGEANKWLGIEAVKMRPGVHQIPEFTLYCSMAQQKHGAAYLALTCEDFNNFARGREITQPMLPGLIQLSQLDHEVMRWMVVMAHKVFFFASIPRFAPETTRKAPTKAEGGKPGFRNRPSTLRKVIAYLPAVRREVREEAANISSEATRERTFKGRRGHMRTLRAERFVNKRGQRIFVAPVPGPGGEVPPRVFKVIKPSASANLT